MKPTYARRLIGVTAAGALALGGTLLGTTAASADAPPVTLTGTVLDAGAPATGVWVELERLDPASGNWYWVDDELTDASGAWSLTDTLSDGSYAFWFSPTSSSSAIYSTEQTSTGSDEWSDMAPQFTVTSGAASVTTFPQTLARNAGAVSVTIQDVNGVTLGAPGTYSGSAQINSGYDAQGKYVGGRDAYSAEHYDPVAATWVSDFAGTVVVGGLKPGTYYGGSAWASGYPSEYFDTVIPVAVGATTDLGAVRLPATAAAPKALTLLTAPRKVAVTGEPKVGSLLTATLPAGAVTASYQWYADHGVIPGATAQTFAPTTAQLGQSLSVTATVRQVGYGSSQLYSESTVPVALGDPDAPVVTLAGTATFGKALKAVVSAPTVGGAVYTYHWYRNGAPIAGADGSSYTIAKGDVGKRIRVGVSSFAQGHSDGVIPSAEVLAKDTTKLTVTPASKKITAKTKLKVKVALSKGGSTVSPKGTAKVYYSTTRFTSVSLKGTKAKSVTLPKLKKGTYTIKVVFESGTFTAATKTFKLKVTK
ncbi:hypothetical protein QT381_05570 [Galbitalea sp. SE-J8]|uniref:hypothetical protein n=1 Tax=Galbitalea sp. SE-J8 TaxID=3054952 RepID=UPI00259CFF89|nr:hypothetical protein [Galbitalea sp. SE-J8]MDM4762471.1 hypothetical protein [Galbitalea sp. SE-J8]